MTVLSQNILREVPDDVLFPFLQYLIEFLDSDVCTQHDRYTILELLSEFTLLCIHDEMENSVY